MFFAHLFELLGLFSLNVGTFFFIVLFFLVIWVNRIFFLCSDFAFQRANKIVPFVMIRFIFAHYSLKRICIWHWAFDLIKSIFNGFGTDPMLGRWFCVFCIQWFSFIFYWTFVLKFTDIEIISLCLRC